MSLGTLKKKTDVTIRGGSRRQSVKFFKVVFKIHFRPFWLILVEKNFSWKNGGSHASPFFANFWILKIFTSVWHFKRAKKHFFPKSDPNGLVSEEEKIHCIFRYLLHFLLKGSLSWFYKSIQIKEVIIILSTKRLWLNSISAVRNFHFLKIILIALQK